MLTRSHTILDLFQGINVTEKEEVWGFYPMLQWFPSVQIALSPYFNVPIPLMFTTILLQNPMVLCRVRKSYKSQLINEHKLSSAELFCYHFVQPGELSMLTTRFRFILWEGNLLPFLFFHPTFTGNILVLRFFCCLK